MAAERSPSGAMADGARRSVAVPNGEGVASGSATESSFFAVKLFVFFIIVLKIVFFKNMVEIFRKIFDFYKLIITSLLT